MQANEMDQQEDEETMYEDCVSVASLETPPESPDSSPRININLSGPGAAAFQNPIRDDEGIMTAAITLISLGDMGRNKETRRYSQQQVEIVSEDYICTDHEGTPILLSEFASPPEESQYQPRVRATEIEMGARSEAAALQLHEKFPNPGPRFFDVLNNASMIVQPSTIDEFCRQPTELGYRGIKGHQNSCYMDSLLFSMFAFTTTFDNLLLKGELRRGDDSPTAYTAHEARNLLSNHIVNVLRMRSFCAHDAITEFRTILSSCDEKFKYDQMDVEEAMTCIFKLWKLQPFIRYETLLSKDFIHQITPRGFAHGRFTTIQSLFEASLIRQELQLMAVPSPALILVYPRWEGKLVDSMPGLVPSLYLNLTHSLRNGLRHCVICDEIAEVECRDCFEFWAGGAGMKSTSYCPPCFEEAHEPEEMRKHRTIQLTTSLCLPRDPILELEAVICFRDLHFVTFVKQSGYNAPWYFHDSNPVGNKTLTKYLPDMTQWIRELEPLDSEEIQRRWTSMDSHLQRILTDGHICIYRGASGPADP